VRKEIGKEGKDHRGLPIQIMHTWLKSWVGDFRKYFSAVSRYSLELFSSMPMSYDQRKNHLRWRATELRFYGSEEAVLRVRLPERWTPIWALTKRGYTPEPVTS
jgi:hypothetical protein